MFDNYAQLPAAVATVTPFTTETVVMVLPLSAAAINVTPEGRVIKGYLNVTVGTAGTLLSVKCRQGNTITGTQVGNTDTLTVTAAAVYQVPFSFLDANSPAPANNQYCITITVTSASAATTVNDGAVELFVPNPGGAAGE